MDLEKLRQKLLKAAREDPVIAHVPHAFEKRIMAHLVNRNPVDLGTWWARGLWRAAAVCVVISLLLSVWSLSSSGDDASVVTLEKTFFSVAEQLSNN